MPIKRLLLCLVAPALLFPGCTSVHMREDTAAAPAYAPDAEYMTQVAVGACAFTRGQESAAALGSTLLSTAISTGINRIGTALTEAAKEKTLTAKTARNMLVQGDTFGPCVQVVRGWFYPDPSPLKTKPDQPGQKVNPLDGNKKYAAALAAVPPDFMGPESVRTLWLENRLWIAAAPDFIFEGRIFKAGENALTIVPQYVRLNEPLFRRTLRRDASRHVAVFLAFAPPGTAADAEASPGATFVLGKLHPGQALRYPDPSTIDAYVPPGTRNQWPHESELFTLALGKDAQPLRVSAAVSETQDASEFLAFVAEVFVGAKESIATEVQKRVIPESRTAARNEAADTRDAAVSAYDEKWLDALAALETCAQEDTAATPTAEQATGARTRLRGLSQAARAANKPVPASEACIAGISVTAPAAAKSACRKLLDDLRSSKQCKESGS